MTARVIFEDTNSGFYKIVCDSLIEKCWHSHVAGKMVIWLVAKNTIPYVTVE